MIKIDKNNMSMLSRGDARVVMCRFTNPNMAPEDGTIAVVSLKRDYNDKDCIWEKKYYIIDGRFDIIFSREDTINLLNDVTYWYDIQILYPDGARWTMIEPTKFKVLGVVGDAGH